MEKANKEKIISGLECCMLEGKDDPFPNCEDCPYANGLETCESLDEMFKDMLSFLKE